MCHGNHDNAELRDSIRLAGIRGLQGVIRKTISDDLVANIWDKQHMEKIVPSLLFNMQNMVSVHIPFFEEKLVKIVIFSTAVNNINNVNGRLVVITAITCRICTSRAG